MLIRFTVSNFLSFDKETEFNMLSGPVKRLDHHLYDLGDLKVLKSSAIYGANGAGKSNFVKALSFFQHVVTEGEWDVVHDWKPFKLKENGRKRPSEFEVELFVKGAFYVYGIAVFGGQISHEWLYKTYPQKGKDVLVFDRKTSPEGTTIQMGPDYIKSDKDLLKVELYEEGLLPNHTTFLKLSGELKETVNDIEIVYKKIADNILAIFPEHTPIRSLLQLIINFTEFEEFFKKTICNVHTGIVDIGIEPIDAVTFFGKNDESLLLKLQSFFDRQPLTEGLHIELDRFGIGDGEVFTKKDDIYIVKRLVFKHKDRSGGYYNFTLNDESDGTRRLIELSPLFFSAIINDTAIIIDEIGRSLHPALAKTLVEKFSQTKTNGQLIFTTHESQLLDQNIFRADEIWFTEKDDGGSTTMYPLSDFKIRHDLDIRKGYLNGRFGAIPFLGNLKDLNWNVHEEEEQVI